MTSLPTEGVTDELASAADGLYEVPAGLTFPGIFGVIAKAHMDRYETNLNHLLKVGIKNHENGKLNPKAQFQQTVRDMMARRKARAEQRGETVPDWPTSWISSTMREPTSGSPGPCACMTARPSPTAHPAYCWSPEKSRASSPTSRCT